MFDVMAGKNCVDRPGGYRFHIGHRTNDVWLCVFIDIKSYLAPFIARKAPGRVGLAFWTASDVKKCSLVHGLNTRERLDRKDNSLFLNLLHFSLSALGWAGRSTDA